MDGEGDPVAVAREIALRALTTRARTRQELAKVLAGRRVPDDAAEEVLARFAEVGLIDDRALAVGWVEGQQRRLRSSRVLAQELRAKGVTAEVVKEVIDDVPPEADEAVARALVARKQRSLAGLAPEVRYRRLAGLLARRGFASSLISRVLRDERGERDELEPF